MGLQQRLHLYCHNLYWVKSINGRVLFSLVSQQGWNCSLCTTTHRSERGTSSTTLSRCHCRFKTVMRGSKVWRPTGWITWPSTSTTEPHWSMVTFTWATWTVSWHDSLLLQNTNVSQEKVVGRNVSFFFRLHLTRNHKRLECFVMYKQYEWHSIVSFPWMLEEPLPLVLVFSPLSRIVPRHALSELRLLQLLKQVPKLPFLKPLQYHH